MTKYFIQIDTGYGYQSDLMRISKKSFDKERYRCIGIVEEKKDLYFKSKHIDEFEDRIQTEYIFSFIYVEIFLIEIVYKK